MWLDIIIVLSVHFSFFDYILLRCFFNLFSSNEIWFDDVDPEDIISASSSVEQHAVQQKQTTSERDTGHQFQLIRGGYEG